MKTPVLCILLALAVTHIANAQVGVLSPQDREALLERLEAIREAAESQIDARYRAAISAYRSALASDDAAHSFYLKCMEKVDFEDQGKSGSEFRDWRRKNDERLKNTAFRRANRYQLRWLALTLEAASQNADRARVALEARKVVDEIFENASSFDGHQAILQQPVTASVFARAYGLGGLRVDQWAFAPGRIAEVYDRILMPPLRSTRNAESLRNAWTKRIQQEIVAIDAWPKTRRDRSRIGMASDMKGPEYDIFMAQELPRLQWSMEVDVFQHGDPGGAAMRMLTHIERNANHTSIQQWLGEFKKLLQAPPASAAAPASESTDETNESPDQQADESAAE